MDELQQSSGAKGILKVHTQMLTIAIGTDRRTSQTKHPIVQICIQTSCLTVWPGNFSTVKS